MGEGGRSVSGGWPNEGEGRVGEDWAIEHPIWGRGGARAFSAGSLGRFAADAR